MDFHRMYGVQVKIVRIFNTYGPYMAANDGRVLSNFIVQALHGEALTVYGDGRQTRCFMYIDDLLKGFRSMMDTGRECTGPVNLGNPTEYTILETAYKVLSLTRSQSPVTFMKSPQDDPRRRKPDIRCARELLGCYITQDNIIMSIRQLQKERIIYATDDFSEIISIINISYFK